MSNLLESKSSTDLSQLTDVNYPFVISSLSNRLAELKKEHQYKIESLELSQKEKISELTENHRIALAEADQKRLQELADLHFQFKNSLTWRIGSFFINLIKYLKNFLYNPIRFFTSPDYRRKNVDIRPRKRTAPKPNTFAKSTVKVSQISPDVSVDKGKLTVLSVMDTFTLNCFKPEFNILAPSPETWQSMFSESDIDAVFIESAWVGNSETWRYQIGKYNNEQNKILKELVGTAKSKQIPVIFWNKEDPVHFDQFLVAAKLADHIFTTDADCIPKYKEDTGINSVYALPFAAQEKIHNPVRVGSRTGMTCFAGTYYNQRYPDRKADLDIILKPALDFNLVIYDRNFDRTDKHSDQLRFPDIYKNAVEGKLEYDKMVEAYKNYKVFLNVNSVRSSPTMFARRVYELLACGTPVISTYSKGIIEILGEGTVLITESEEDTRRHLQELLNNESYWWKKSLEGMRIVHEEHTYHHRSAEIFNKVGLSFQTKKPVAFLVVSDVASSADFEYLIDTLNRQHYKSFSILLLVRDLKLSTNEIREKVSASLQNKDVDVLDIATFEAKGKEILDEATTNYVAFFDLQSYYGKNYLRDYANSINYSGAKKLGKKAYFKTSNSDSIKLMNAGCEFNYMADVPTASLVIEKSKLDTNAFAAMFYQDTSYDFEISTLSIDPYNFIKNGRVLQKAIQKQTEI